MTRTIFVPAEAVGEGDALAVGAVLAAGEGDAFLAKAGDVRAATRIATAKTSVEEMVGFIEAFEDCLNDFPGCAQ